MTIIPVQVVGLGMSPADLTPRGRRIIEEAQVLVGGKRLLGYFPDHPAKKIPLGKDPQSAIRQIPALAETKRVVVLASGDPNFYGVAPLVVQLLGADRVVIHPNVTAVQAASARLKIAWQDAVVVSLHGRSWEPLEAALTEAGKLMIYTDPDHTPGDVARLLLARGQGGARLAVLEDLGEATERLTWLRPGEAQGRKFSPLNLVVVLQEAAAGETFGKVSLREGGLGGGPVAQASPPVPEVPGPPPKMTLPATRAGRTNPRLHLGLPEEALAHQGGLITKTEVRAVVLARLQLLPGQVVWDVGAGCGSVGLEACLLTPGGKVFAVELDPARAAQIRANREKFGVASLEVICGRAPECLAGLPAPQRVFLGGGGREVGEILRAAIKRLGNQGRVVLTAARLETLEIARAVLAEAGWEVELTQLQVSRSRPLGGGAGLQAFNPVWIIAGWPKGDEL
jgi:precorrin-6Y C5,15-methyltransferase (decarboxylating)